MWLHIKYCGMQCWISLKLILKPFFMHVTKLFAKPVKVTYSYKTSTKEADTRNFLKREASLGYVVNPKTAWDILWTLSEKR